MAGLWRALRAQLMTPDMVETTMSRRGFHVKDEATRRRLESVGTSFLTGFRAAVEARADTDIGRLELIERQFRGFAYEGAAMGYAILDGVAPGGGRTARFLAGAGAPHVYMAYVGIGWAYAKLPRWRWRAVPAPDRLLRWLVLDGLGFHRAYFQTDRFVRRQEDGPVAWPPDVPGDYARRAVDQGIGRASWFVAGADPDVAAELIGRFDESRHGDLWSGMGLAATYAGGADQDDLKKLYVHAGRYRPQLAQGSAFAAQARLYAGLVTEHTPVATGIFCGCTPQEAAAVTERERATLPPDAAEPAYEVWRQRIQAHFA
ncbi:DUF1702 family protein [Micromonospora deserti]|uniref:Enediyne biosynthesis protein n=1 Tax=Micromonospora deserti TaxID=2070366 RepID=A0A2W2CHT8_9ACTN|nr:DUF1702 family protein [Micromonospora deserti]PZF92514.1 enediyne biosynthesis protein [Micromonospora deserti]